MKTIKYPLQKRIIGDGSGVKTFVKNVCLFFMSYIVYLFTIPLVLLIFFMVSLVIITTISMVFHLIPDPSLGFIKYIPFIPKTFTLNLHITKDKVLIAFTFITLIITIIGNFLNYLFNIKIEIAPKNKFKILFVIIIVSYVYIILAGKLFISQPVEIAYYLALGVFGFITLLCLVAWFLISKGYSSIYSTLQKNDKSHQQNIHFLNILSLNQNHYSIFII